MVAGLELLSAVFVRLVAVIVGFGGSFSALVARLVV